MSFEGNLFLFFNICLFAIINKNGKNLNENDKLEIKKLVL